MYFINLKCAKWAVAAMMLTSTGALMTSCSKDLITEQNKNNDNKLTISVVGIHEEENLPSKGSKGSQETSGTAKYKVFGFGEADMAVSLDNELPIKTIKTSISSASNRLSATGGLRAEAVEQGVKYVVYIYNADNTFVTSKILSSGSAGTISGLEPQTSYKWVALSYNSIDDAPPLQPGNSNILDLPLNQDVLYASGTVDLSMNQKIEIMFSHKFARVGIEINTIGIFGQISTTSPPIINIDATNLSTGSINLLDGALAPSAPAAISLTYADFIDVDPGITDRKIVYLYTTQTSSSPNFLVTVKNLTIDHVDRGVNNAGPIVSRTFFANAQLNSNFNVYLQLGKSHHLTINLVEPAMWTSYNGHVKWARSNLYYRGNIGGTRNYAFYAKNEQTSRGDGYFSFGSIIPGRFPSTALQQDPCALVHPAGMWRTPLEHQYYDNYMIGSKDLLTNILDDISGSALPGNNAPNATLGSNYVEYPVNAGAPAPGTTNAFGDETNASNRLRFYFNGHINNPHVLQAIGEKDGLLNVGLSHLSADLVGVKLSNTNIALLNNFNDLTALWTKSQGIGLLGLEGAGTWGYIGYPRYPSTGTPYVKAQKSVELLYGVPALGEIQSTTMKNIRCVRYE